MSKEWLEGAKNGRAVLTEDDVLAIRASEESQSTLSFQYRVSKAQIGKIKRGEAWKHVNPPSGS